jgi:hypothetical protein
MQWLGISYSSWFNARHDRSGPLFQGRFKSIPVEDGAWVYELSLYVHLNPVRTMGYGLDKRARKAAAMGMTKPPTQEQASALVSTVEAWRGEDADVWLHKHGDWGKWLVLNLARRYSGMTLQELGNQMGGMDYAAVSVGLRRFDSRLKQDRKMRGAFKNIVEMLNV